MTSTAKIARLDFERYAITHRMHGYIPASRRYVMDTYIKPGMKVLDLGCGMVSIWSIWPNRFPSGTCSERRSARFVSTE